MCASANDLYDAFATAAAQHADKTAFEVCGGSSISFVDLARRSEALSHGLRTLGIQSADRVGILSPHDPDAVVLFWALLKIGAIVVWLNEDAGVDGWSAVIQDASPRVLFVQSKSHYSLLETVSGDRCQLLQLSEIAPLEENSISSGAASHAVSDDAIAVIVYTSGSSGRPKGVCLSHRNLLTVARAVIQHMPISSDDSYLMVVPMHYVHGLMQLLVHAIAGAKIYCYGSFAFPRKIVGLLRDTGVSGFSGVPFHFNALTTFGGFLDADLPQLKWLTVTGGKLPSDRILEILDNFAGLRFHVAYGQTECAPRATALDPDKLRDKPDSVGSAIPGVTVRLLDDDARPVAVGEVGEVAIGGPGVMVGYWNDPKGTAEVIDSEGRLLTGDLGKFDAEGDLYLVGRKSAMIKSAGERIVPEELENILLQLDSIEDAVVVGVADKLLGQKVVAHLLMSTVVAAGETEQAVSEIRDHVLNSIPFARAPKDYKCWSEFPRKANGKPDRQKLVAMGGRDE